MTKTDWEEKIRKICTYHTDDGTSGYELSEEQFQEVFGLIDQELKRERRKMVREIKDWLDVQAVSDWLTKSGTPRIVHDLKSYLDNYLKEREE